MNEEIFAKGRLFELVHLQQPDGRIFEVARRAPGVRVLMVDLETRKLLLTKEFRRELNAYDYRLPGGKVFDSLSEFETFRQSGSDIVQAAKEKAEAEAQEEAGMAIADVELFKKSTLGATVEWDLFVFVAKGVTKHEKGQSLEQGEVVDDVSWYDFKEVEHMILRGDMQEERIALIVLQWLNTQ